MKRTTKTRLVFYIPILALTCLILYSLFGLPSSEGADFRGLIFLVFFPIVIAPAILLHAIATYLYGTDRLKYAKIIWSLLLVLFIGLIFYIKVN